MAVSRCCMAQLCDGAGSELDRVLEFAQAVELLLRQPLLVVVRVGEVFLGVLDLLPERVGVQVLERDGCLRKQDEARLARVGKAAAHEDAACACPRASSIPTTPGRIAVITGAWSLSTWKSPSAPGTSTAWAEPLNSTLSGDTSSKWKVVGMGLPRTRRS